MVGELGLQRLNGSRQVSILQSSILEVVVSEASMISCKLQGIKQHRGEGMGPQKVSMVSFTGEMAFRLRGLRR